ncbi:MAG TPA: tannase/feruloyl esterase family alpha/beta hydrolase [Vicinamibacterales bacterium]
MITKTTKIIKNALAATRFVSFVSFVLFVISVRSASSATCESIAALSLPNAKVTAAQQVAPGAFTPPGPTGPASPVYAKLPSFCRVTATLTPSTDSDIKIEVWLPASAWNGKFQAVGNGGWNGNIPYAALANAVLAGYATAGTDTGHVGNSASFAFGHPEKLIDFGYRAVHEMTVKAKSIVDAFYGSMPTLSIWNGCSQGGRQGVTAAVRYPTDFDGIVVGAPAVNFVNLHAGRVALNRSVNATPAGVIPAVKYPLIHQAVLAACDAKDGVADEVLENPGACAFDPKVLQCSAHEDSTCLSAPQVESATKMYAGAKHPDSKALVLPGLAPGAELGWNVLGNTQPLSLAVDAFKYVFMKDRTWEASRFNAGVDIDVALASDPDDALGSTNADLRPFFARGGKLLMYHGWSDPQVTPYNTINFFHKVLATQGGAGLGTSMQLYMVPGMNHCAGGPGTDVFDKVGALEEWIKTGSAPARIEAARYTNGIVDRTRPLCPLGQVARWSGTGSTDDAANFACVASTVAGR